MSYRIITDSTCDMPQEYYRENDIEVIGLTFLMDEKEYVEGPNQGISVKEYYDMLRAGSNCSTMQVNTYDFVAFAEPFLAAGDDVLCLAFSSGLSGTYESYVRGGQELAEKYPDRKLVIVDTLCASMGEGLLLYYAVENRKNGMSLEDNAAWLESNKLNLCQWFTVDDLMFLHRGGRVSKTSAILGSLIGIKPVLHVDNEGHLILMNKARGRAGSINALAEKLHNSALNNIDEQMVMISHGDCLKDAETLRDLLKEKFGIHKFMISTIGAVIGAHSGPGTIALFFLGKQR